MDHALTTIEDPRQPSRPIRRALEAVRIVMHQFGEAIVHTFGGAPSKRPPPLLGVQPYRDRPVRRRRHR